MGKLFESVIHTRISKLADSREMILDHQFGFRKKHSTIHAINKLTSDICWALNDDQVLAACLIDLEKAFDTVWTQGLLYKLLKKGFPHLINITWNMTLGWRFRVLEQGKISTKTFSVKNRLQQGAINSPKLFNLFFSDLLTLFKINEGQECKAIVYADDLIIYSHHRKISMVRDKLQDLMQKINNYWKIKINFNK